MVTSVFLYFSKFCLECKPFIRKGGFVHRIETILPGIKKFYRRKILYFQVQFYCIKIFRFWVKFCGSDISFVKFEGSV
ncbi:hypothetical protein D7Y09_06285 [bacterium 1XD42-1]|nr:hypothetical protein D7X25_04080 [bacterium 1XD42-8]RKJ65396.1 hypothetical protein D7Y09_06285 [bacterium 1XD42-1]